MRPLPITPIDGRPDVPNAPQPRIRPGVMRPLPMPHPDHLTQAPSLVDAIRDAAVQRLLDQHGVTDADLIDDPTA